MEHQDVFAPEIDRAETHTQSVSNTNSRSLEGNDSQFNSSNHSGTTSLDQLSTFTLFMQLPTELQDLIWLFAIPRPAKMKLTFTTIGSTEKKRHLFATDPKNTPTGMLQACKASRDIAVKALPSRLPTADRSLEIRYNDGTTSLDRNDWWVALAILSYRIEAMKGKLVEAGRAYVMGEVDLDKVQEKVGALEASVRAL